VGGEEEDVVLQRQPRPLGRRWLRHGRLLSSSLVQSCCAPVPVDRSGVEWGLERRRGQHSAQTRHRCVKGGSGWPARTSLS
jgi:hypothetical protein